MDAGWPLGGAADHGVSEALYLDDPDGNGVKLCRDRPEAEWPRGTEPEPHDVQPPAQLEALLRAADEAPVAASTEGARASSEGLEPPTLLDVLGAGAD